MQAGTVSEHGVVLPPPLPLTSEKLERHGLFLFEDGQNIFLWVGCDAVPQLIQDVFDLPGYEALRAGKARNDVLIHTCLILTISFHVDSIASSREQLLAACERHHPEDA